MSMFRRRLLMQQAQYMSLPEPIAKYEAYNYTNDSEGKEVLTDLTGNGHDIQLYNFAFAESSGYGKYNWNFNTFKLNNAEHTSSKIIFNKESFPATFETWIVPNNGYISVDKIKGVTIKVSGIKTSTLNFYIVINTRDNNTYPIIVNNIDINKDGIYTLQDVVIPENYNGNLDLCYYGFREINISANETVVIEQIPDYKGALVSDGVDDRGICFPFPKLSADNGYTVLSINAYIDKGKLVESKVLLTKRINDRRQENSVQFGEFTLNKIITDNSQVQIYNYGSSYITANTNFVKQIHFDSLTSKKFNNVNIHKGSYLPTDCLSLFCGYSFIESNNTVSLSTEYGSFALYALEIYDRDLTDEEIAKVKERMIKRYEEKTGEKFEELN